MKNGSMRTLLAATAVSLAFSPMAQAGGLIDDTAALAKYTPAFSTAIRKASGDDLNGGLRAGGFMSELEKTLKEPNEKVRVVDYPKPSTVESIRILAVVPPKGMESHNIPVCAERNGKVFGTWNISAKGDVVPAPWTGQIVPEIPNGSACKAFVVAARADISQKYAQLQQPETAPAAKPERVAAAGGTGAPRTAPLANGLN